MAVTELQAAWAVESETGAALELHRFREGITHVLC